MSKYIVQRWREVFTPNMAALRSRLAADGFQVSQWVDQPNAVYGWRKHPNEQSHWIISGSVRVTIKTGGSYVLNVGDRDFIPAETYYWLEVIGEEAAMYMIGEKAKVAEKKKRGRKKK